MLFNLVCSTVYILVQRLLPSPVYIHTNSFLWNNMMLFNLVCSTVYMYILVNHLPSSRVYIHTYNLYYAGQCTNASTCMSTNALAVPLAAVLCTVLSSVISSVVTGFITCYCFMKRSKKEGYEHHNQRPSQIEPEYENPFLFRKNLANIELKQNTCYATQADVQAI